MRAHKIIVKAFRAVDEPAACLEFLRGHLAVLEKFKIAHITSNTIEWTKRESTVAFTIESLEDGSMLGGGRLQVFDYHSPLPIERAVGDKDKKIYTAVHEWAQGGVAEFCGLWNTREAIKLGISSIFIAQVGVAIASQLKIRSLLALCAPATVKTSKRVGFSIEKSLGQHGTFYYPKIDLLATLFRMGDVNELSQADKENRAIIFELREKKNFKKIISPVGIPCEIHYQLEVRNLEKSRFYHLHSQINELNPK